MMAAFSEKPVHRILDVFPPDDEVFQLPFKSHEKVLFDRINVLVDIYDVSQIAGDETCYFGYDALPVRAMQKSYGAFFHVFS